MNKLIITQESASKIYRNELNEIADHYLEIPRKNLNDLNIQDLEKIDVAISNQLNYQWKIILNGLKIISIIIDKYKEDKYADLYIDYLGNKKNKYFFGKHYKFSNRAIYNVNYLEVLDIITFLDWDSSFWGFNVSYLSARKLSNNIIYRINNFNKKKKIRLVQYLCDCHDQKSVDLAEINRFQFKDIRLTYVFDPTTLVVKNELLSDGISLAGKKDIKILREISKNIYIDSRYYYDNNFDEEKTIEFYMLWVEKAVLGTYDNDCYILKTNDQILGFCTVRYTENDSAQIGLVGIAKENIGLGLGKKLMHNFLVKMKEKKIKKIYVVTQGRNYSAQRLYQKSGFVTYMTELWYHKWI